MSTSDWTRLRELPEDTPYREELAAVGVFFHLVAVGTWRDVDRREDV